MFISSLLFSALDSSPGPKSQHTRLKLCFGHKLSVSFFKLSGLVLKGCTTRTISDLAVCTQIPRDAVLCSDEDFHHVCIWKLGLVEQAAHSAFAVGQFPVAGVLCNGKQGKVGFQLKFNSKMFEANINTFFFGGVMVGHFLTACPTY